MSANDDDPVIASYDVFLNKPLPKHKRLFVLQHANRSIEENRPFIATPQEMRVKPNAGLVEVDVPVNTVDNYDKDKGMYWGRALAEATALKGGGRASFGLAGGFGIGAPPPPRSAGKRRQEEMLHLGGDWMEESRRGRVLATNTLGGDVIEQEGEPVYMIGVFHGVSGLIQLRPKMHHVDAVNYIERLPQASAAGKDSAGGGVAASSASGSASAAGGGAARAIQMTVKTATDNEAAVTETIVDRLRAIQAEPWCRLRYFDENSDRAWQAYEDTLLPLRQKFEEQTAEPTDPSKPAALEAREEATPGASEKASLRYAVPHLQSLWDSEELMDHVSATIQAPPVASKPAQDAMQVDV